MHRYLVAYFKELGRAFRLIWRDAREFDLQGSLERWVEKQSDETRMRLLMIEAQAHQISRESPVPWERVHRELSAYTYPFLYEGDADFETILNDGAAILRLRYELLAATGRL